MEIQLGVIEASNYPLANSVEGEVYIIVKKSERLLEFYECIVSEIEKGQCPDWNTASGGAIMIHGCGGSSDWTAGCVTDGNKNNNITMNEVNIVFLNKHVNLNFLL